MHEGLDVFHVLLAIEQFRRQFVVVDVAVAGAPAGARARSAASWLWLWMLSAMTGSCLHNLGYPRPVPTIVLALQRLSV